MKKIKLHTNYKQVLADTFTPVSVYLKIRDKFPNSTLLESSDYHTNNNSFSYICCNPIAYFKIENNEIEVQYPQQEAKSISISRETNVIQELENFKNLFETSSNDLKFISNGLFGYTAYDAIQYFEKVNIQNKSTENQIPQIYYSVYQNIIAINHFKNEAFIICNSVSEKDNIKEIEQILQAQNVSSFGFSKTSETKANINDNQYVEIVKKAKQHCHRGDVFQLVLSKRFEQEFKGDEFNVYRALRNVNPSPYLFYFDYGNFKIFGSSPEAQLVIQNQKAEIHPIAGTFKRSGNDELDSELAKKLSVDTKENSEHIMLVDLARNDLSRSCNNVKVETFKEVQFFSHVIHLVSKVTGNLQNKNSLNLAVQTFPAGTLSGAPKVKAMQLIEELETTNRSFYGGAIGFMDFNGNFNHAIMIRSFLSKNHTLYFQAGAGIVESSKEENELQEVYNKIGALQKALEMAETI